MVADPYQNLEVDPLASVTLSSAHNTPTEFAWPTDPNAKVPQKWTDTEHFINSMAERDLRPEKINGMFFENFTMEKLQTASRNIKRLSTWMNAPQWRQDLSSRNLELEMAATRAMKCVSNVFHLPLNMAVLDYAVGIDDPSRKSGTRGSRSTKFRFAIQVDEDGDEIQVAYITTCNEKPPPEYRRCQNAYFVPYDRQWDRLRMRFQLPVVPADVDTKVFKKKCHSYVHFSRPVWVSLRHTPIILKGELSIEGLQNLADAMRLPEDHNLRRTHNEKRDRKLNRAGDTEEKGAARLERFGGGDGYTLAAPAGKTIAPKTS